MHCVSICCLRSLNSVLKRRSLILRRSLLAAMLLCPMYTISCVQWLKQLLTRLSPTRQSVYIESDVIAIAPKVWVSQCGPINELCHASGSRELMRLSMQLSSSRIKVCWLPDTVSLSVKAAAVPHQNLNVKNSLGWHYPSARQIANVRPRDTP